MKYSIIIPTYNHCNDLLRPCIESIKKYTDLSSAEVIIVANGCTDNTFEYVNSLGQDFKLIWHDQPLGYTKAVNIGINASTGEYVILLNNDIELTEQPINHWLTRLEEPFDKDPYVAVTGPFVLNHLTLNAVGVVFFCAMIKNTVFKEIGLLDENYSPGGVDDHDFCYRATLAGFKLSDTGSTPYPLIHKDNQTFKSVDYNYNKVLDRNTLYFIEKFHKPIKYSIVIPTYNHCNDLLKPCIESIQKYTDLTGVEIIVVANGCTDNTREYVESLGKPVKLVWFDNALGYSRANNAGIRIASGDKIVLLNNDTVLLNQPTNHWLELLNSNFANPNCGISSVNNLYSEITQRHFAVFFCVMVKKAVFDKIGLLNEDYGTGSSEDIEFCYLAEQAGFKVCQVGSSTYVDNFNSYTGSFPIYHKGEGTVHDTSLVSGWNDIFFQNELKLAKKYNIQWYNKNVNRYNKTTKIAVITPVYNDATNIENAIRTVRKQTIGNVKHYIYNDASTDNTAQTLDNYQLDNGIFIKTGLTNQGQSIARNVLIEQALVDGCTLIAFLDSDDTWSETHLEKNIKYLDNNDIVYSTPQFYLENGSPAAPFNITIPTTFVGKQLAHNNFIWISSVVAKSDCFVNNKFDSLLDSIEDWDMWYRLNEQKFKFYKAPDITCSYLVRSTGQAGLGSIKRHMFEKKHRALPALAVNRVLCSISTRGRYDTTLSLSIQAVINQTKKVDKLVIFDDNDQPTDLREIQLYDYLFNIMNLKGIAWEVIFGKRQGQHHNHQIANQMGYEWVWRVDDDCIPETNVLETLFSYTDSTVGAVGGSVLTPPFAPVTNATGKIENLDIEANIQWDYIKEYKEVDHLHCSFLYRAGVYDYNLKLSRVAHREETLFTYGLKQKGYRICVVPNAVTWHLKNKHGGIRTEQYSLFEHDETIFRNILGFKDRTIVVLDCGLGDHIVFKKVLADIENPVVFSCWPEIIPGRSIAEAVQLLGDIDRFNIYAQMDKWQWTGSLEDAFRKLYLK